MRIGKKCTVYNNEFLLRIQLKKKLFFDKLGSSYTLTRKKGQNTQLLNSIKKTLFFDTLLLKH
jgi:TfoX/Sxy family transcriptional regulator of competence genes